MRTKRVVELVAQEIIKQNPELSDRALELAQAVLEAAGITISTKPSRKSKKDKDEELPPAEAGYLLFLSNGQIRGLAELAVQAASDAGDEKLIIDKKEARARADRAHSVDVSLFGRMVADATDLNVDAAAQVAHALSVHKVDNEYDYFTAVDDHKKADEAEDAGAGMIGTVEFNSSTLYRYATVDVNRLHDNLGDDAATRRAIEAFVRAFVSSMPTGKQNTFANRTLPDAVLVVIRDSQSINFVGAYEDAVEEKVTGGRIAASIERLAQHGRELHEAFDEQPVAAWHFGVGERIAPLAGFSEHSTFSTTIEAVGTLVADRLSEK